MLRVGVCVETYPVSMGVPWAPVRFAQGLAWLKRINICVHRDMSTYTSFSFKDVINTRMYTHPCTHTCFGVRE